MQRFLPSRSLLNRSFLNTVLFVSLAAGQAAPALAQESADDAGVSAPGPADAVQVAAPPVVAALEPAAPLPGSDLVTVAPVLKPELSVPTSYLVTGLKDDFKRLPSKFTAYSLGIGAAVALAVHPADERLAGIDGQPSRYQSFFSAGQAAGCGWAQYGGAVATFVIAKIAGNYEAQVIGADLVRAQIMTAGIVYGIKGIAQRERPDGGQYSFPSGHSATTFATATVLWNRLGWKVGLPAYLLAGYVATSRVPDQRHYASDVAFGSAIGLAAGQAVSGGDRKRIAVAPLLAPGTVGIQFAKGW